MDGVPGWLRTGFPPALVLTLSLVLTGGVLAARAAAPPAAKPGGTPGVVAAPPAGNPGGAAAPAADADPWSARAPYPIAISQQALAAQDGVLYSFGGVSQGHSVADAFKYDPVANGWTRIHSLRQNLAKASAVSDGTGIYILNGFNGQTDQNLLYRYDPQTDNYTILPPPGVTTSAQAAVYLGGRIYRIGGTTNGTPTRSVEVYTVATNSWAPAPDYPLAVSWLMATAANGVIYTAGGIGLNNASTAKTYSYNPAAGFWDDGGVPDLPQALWGAAGGWVNGRWLLAGGIAHGAYGSDLLTWDGNPADAWRIDAQHPLPQARYSMGSASTGPALYSVGGCSGGDCRNGTQDTQQYQAPTFWDVAPSDYYYAPVLYLVAHRIVSGYSDGTFRPGAHTTRGQLAKIVALAEQWPLVTPPTAHFSDVPPGSPFYSFVETSVAHGVISGYSDGTFRPGADVTRGQLSKIIVGARGWPLVTPTSAHFADVPPGSPFYPFVETAVARGIVSGYADGTFRPGNPATRGQIAKIVYLAILAGAGPPTATATATDTPVISATPTPTCAPSWQIVPSPNLGTLDTLSAISAVGPYDVWAVGNYYNGVIYQPLTEHWNGANWNVVPGPTVGAGPDSNLTGVAAVSPNDVWAVGFSSDAMGTYSTLVEHWNGSSWTIIPSPNVGTASNQLYAVTAISATDIWAVGLFYTTVNYGPNQALIEHWDGATWTVISSPNSPSSINQLTGISAVAADDIWAVGDNGGQTLTEHWDGFAWSIIPSPNVGTQWSILSQVAGIATDDVWAIGSYGDPQTLIEHWNGIQWLIVPSPNAQGDNFLEDIAAVGRDDVWAVGDTSFGDTLVLHWNGTSWSIIPSPNPVGGLNTLNSIAVVNAGDLWAAGGGNRQTLIERYHCP